MMFTVIFGDVAANASQYCVVKRLESACDEPEVSHELLFRSTVHCVRFITAVSRKSSQVACGALRIAVSTMLTYTVANCMTVQSLTVQLFE